MKRYIAIASALLLSVAANAQNLNPTVQVTNAYDNKLMNISKTALDMAVPDSLMRFDWNFNYSVFENPYKGAYEFNPYVIEMRPDAVAYDGTRLYVRAGAGYTLHPEALVVWNPNLKGRWGLVVSDDFKGYWGNYCGSGSESLSAGEYKITAGDAYKGHDLSNRFGTTLTYKAPETIVSLDGGVNFLQNTGAPMYSYNSRGISALGTEATLRVRSNAPSSAFFYDASAHAKALLSGSKGDAISSEKETDFGASALLAYVFTERSTAKLDLGLDRYDFKGYADAVQDALELNVTPMYRFYSNRFVAEAGIKFSNVWRNVGGLRYDDPSTVAEADPVVGTEEEEVFDYKGRKFYPHVHLAYEAVEDALVVSADLKGGQKYNSYASMLYTDQWFNSTGSLTYWNNIGDATVTTFDASLGLSGRIAHKFQYKMDAGYARLYNAPLDGIDYISSGKLVYKYDMTNYDLLYADLSASWSSDRFDANGSIRGQKSDFRKFKYAATLPNFLGSVEAKYNWNKRIYAGVSVEWATKRVTDGEEVTGIKPSVDEMMSAYSCTIPGWVDLGLSAEYKLNNMFTVWAKGGNLLNQTVRKSLLVAEKGPYFTLGVCLNL